MAILGRLLSYWLCFRGDPQGAGYKSALITFWLVQSLVVLPVCGIIVGAFVGWFAQRSAWWLAGLSLLPLLIFNLAFNWEGAELFLSIVDLVLSMSTSFGVSWLKGRKRNVKAIPAADAGR